MKSINLLDKNSNVAILLAGIIALIIGVGVAWARLKGEEIPMEYKTVRLKTLKTGDKFIIANNKDFKETYTFVGRYNFESIDKCFCATGEKLEKLAAFYSDTVVIKL